MHDSNPSTRGSSPIARPRLLECSTDGIDQPKVFPGKALPLGVLTLN